MHVLILKGDSHINDFNFRCDPKKLYKLFIKATQIEAIIEKLNGCFLPAANSKAKLNLIAQSLKVAQKEIDVIGEKYDRLKSVETIKVSDINILRKFDSN